MTNLRDPSTLGLEYENDIFHPIAHFDSPSFQFRLYRPPNMDLKWVENDSKETPIKAVLTGGLESRIQAQQSEESRGFSPIDKVLGEDAETEKDEFSNLLGGQTSSTPILDSAAQFAHIKLAGQDNSNSKPVPLKKRSNTNHGPTGKFVPGHMILGLPSYIFEGIDFSFANLQRYGVDVSHLNVDTNAIEGLPKSSVILSLISNRIPALNSSKIYFVPPLPSLLSDSQNAQPNGSSNDQRRSYYPISPILTTNQKLIYQQFPLQNLSFFYKKCSENPLKMNDYCPLVYRSFHPVVTQEYQLQAYKTQFSNTYKKFMGDYNPVLIRYIIDFWLSRLSFPIAVEPILLYFHYLNNKQHLLSRNRIQNILFKRFCQEFQFPIIPLAPSVYQSTSSSDDEAVDPDDETGPSINYELRKKQFSFLELLNDFEPLIRLDSFTSQDFARKNLIRAATTSTIADSDREDITEESSAHPVTTAPNSSEKKDNQLNEDNSSVSKKINTMTDSAFHRITRRESKDFKSRSSSFAAPPSSTTATTTASSSSLSNQPEVSYSVLEEGNKPVSHDSSTSSSSSGQQESPPSPSVTMEDFRFWLEHLELYHQSTVSPIERYDLGIRSKENKLEQTLNAEEYDRFHQLHAFLGPQYDDCSSSLQMLRLIFASSELTKQPRIQQLNQTTSSSLPSVPLSSQPWFSHYFPTVQSTTSTTQPATTSSSAPEPAPVQDPVTSPIDLPQDHQMSEDAIAMDEDQPIITTEDTSREDVMEVESAAAETEEEKNQIEEVVPMESMTVTEPEAQPVDNNAEPTVNEITTTDDGRSSSAGDGIIRKKKRGRPSLKDIELREKEKAAQALLAAASSPVSSNGLKRTRR